MNKLTPLLISAVTFFLAACSDNPVADVDAGEEELTATLQLSEDHVHTLEEVTFTASITDHHGNAFTDLAGVSLEYRLEGAAEWRSRDMVLSGNAFTDAMAFFTSGEYQVRVMGMHHGHDHAEMLYQMTDHLQVGRAHVSLGDYRVEYESFPGHIHEGDTATMRFWVMESSDPRPPVAGLTAEIHCTESSGLEESHGAVESATGIYEAEHTFQEAGETHVAIHFPGAGGEVEAEFHFPVSHGH